jgi:hypothetical protein
LTIATNAVLNIGGIYNESLNGMLTNAGTVNWTGTFPFLAPIYWFSLLLNWKRPRPANPNPPKKKTDLESCNLVIAMATFQTHLCRAVN